ncbi:hypothetical protein FIBSPDRAFT_864853 [Athelia psychrophila]|uniref:Uncharacterized protein n=1 Tax=Athelia psychrophila TaxID=1759441 RepID=A0A166G4B1_9AGAM|nr:hypothetical protein FIBSPDRAFT_864853 [Fibularhizoctonia sp. CBS 109695]
MLTFEIPSTRQRQWTNTVIITAADKSQKHPFPNKHSTSAPFPAGPNTTPTIFIIPNTAIISPLATTPLAQTAVCSPTVFPFSAAATCVLLFRSTRSDAPATTTAETYPRSTNNTSGEDEKMIWSVSEIFVGKALSAMESCFFATEVAWDPGAEDDVEYRAAHDPDPDAEDTFSTSNPPWHDLDLRISVLIRSASPNSRSDHIVSHFPPS